MLNRYNLKFPLRSVKLYSNLAIFSNPASGSGQKYKIPRNTDNPMPSSSRSRESSPSPRPSGSRSRDPSPPPRPSGSGGSSARSTPPATRQGAAFARNTKLSPYCEKFLSGECTYGKQCKFIHVSEGNLFKYLIYENSPNFTFIRRETEIGIVPEPGSSRQLPESPNFRGQDRPPLSKKKSSVIHINLNYLVECSIFEFKLLVCNELIDVTALENLNKSFKTLSNFVTSVTRKVSESCLKPDSLKHSIIHHQKTLKNSQMSEKTKGLARHSLATKKLKKLKSKQFSNLNIMSSNIRGLGGRVATLLRD